MDELFLAKAEKIFNEIFEDCVYVTRILSSTDEELKIILIVDKDTNDNITNYSTFSYDETITGTIEMALNFIAKEKGYNKKISICLEVFDEI